MLSERSARIAVVVALVCAAIVSARPAAAARGADGPLRNEDVVRWLVAGEAPSAVVERLRARQVEFDLSDEMIDELRLAGVPDLVIAAMRDRQAETHPPPAGRDGPPATPESFPAAGHEGAVDGSVRTVSLVERTPQAGDGVRVRLPAEVPDDLARRLELSSEPSGRRVGSAAWVLACLEPTHVPDHWRSRSPLGRDFFFSPRHRVLAFAEPIADRSQDEAPAADGDGRRRIEITLPSRIEAVVPPGDHSLIFGAAVRIGERWYLVRSVELEAAASGGDDDREIRVRVDWPENAVAPELEVLAPAGEAGH